MRNSARTISCLVVLPLLFTTACNWSESASNCDDTPWLPACSLYNPHQVALQEIYGCQDLLTTLKKTAIEEMEIQVHQNMKDALEYGGCYWGRWDFYPGLAGDGSIDDAVPGGYGPDNSNPGGASEYSTTNTQEAGVDEADFVKNDNKYIYILAGNELMIFDAWPPASTQVLSTVEIEGVPRRLYVHKQRAVVYSDLPREEELTYDECWYNHCQPRNHLKITVLNIQNLRHPVLEREMVFTGSYLNSRRIGDAVHTVVVFPEERGPELRYWPKELNDCSREPTRIEITLLFSRLLSENRRKINNTTLADWLPSISDTRYYAGAAINNSGLLEDCRNFYRPSVPDGQGLLTVLSIDIDDPYGSHLASIIGNRGTVYASTGALYVASTRYAYQHYASSSIDQEEPAEASVIHKFSLSAEPAASAYEGSGAVAGRLLNQFSMGEYEGYLRVATTTGFVRDPQTHNSIYVLDQLNGALVVVGSVTGIAPTEDIRSARFVGDRGFIVTFKKTDPLYAIDLSKPHNPRIAGELKIPGFSTYIHMMDQDHLLTIGFDADDQGNFAWFQGIELQIFDVSDMSNPTQIHKEIIGTRGTSSEATANHLAFNYFPPKKVLALPMAICEGSSGGGSYGDEMTFSGLLVFNATVDDGFSERGRVSHADAGSDYYGCSNWWSNPNSRVKRSIIMDDYVFSISDTLLKVNHLNQLSSDLVELEISQIPRD